MFEAHYTYRTTLNALRLKINQVKLAAKVDLLKMYRTADNIFQDMDRELVNCRRRYRLTSNYETLEQTLLKQIATIEKRLTFAQLL